MSLGAAIIAGVIVGALSLLFTTLAFFLAWNVGNVHDVFGVSVDASFSQLLFAAIIVSCISSSSRASS